MRLATIDADGSPDVTGVGSHWHRGSFWFTASLQSRKGKDLARDPRCTLSVATHEFDLTIEGEAELIVDPELVAELVAVYSAAMAPPPHLRATGDGAGDRRGGRRDSLGALSPAVPSPG